jgi:hypothetical protein
MSLCVKIKGKIYKSIIIIITIIGVRVFNTTSNNISAISWWSVLLVEETGVPRQNQILDEHTIVD